MKRFRLSGLIRAGLAFLAALSFLILPAAAEETAFVENEWNFVEESMDISRGIPEDASGVLGRIREKGVLRVATEVLFAPHSFVDPDAEGQNRYAGADMSLARLIAERMGVELEIIPMDYTEVLPAVRNDQADLAIAALSYTPARAKENELSRGYCYAETERTETVIVIREQDAGELQGVETLADRNLAAVSGTLQESLMAEHVLAYREFRRVASMSELFSLLQGGQTDAAALQAESAEAYFRSNPSCGLTILEGVSFRSEGPTDGDRVAARKGELELMYFVNGVIEEVLDGDRYTAWLEEAGARAAELDLI